MASKADRAKATAKRLRDKMKNARGGAVRRVSNAAISYGIGKGVESGKIESVPSIMGAPRVVTLGLVSAAVAYFAPGTIADIGEGGLDGCLSIASYEFGKGGVEAIAGETAGEVGMEPLPTERYLPSGGGGGDDADDAELLEALANVEGEHDYESALDAELEDAA